MCFLKHLLSFYNQPKTHKTTIRNLNKSTSASACDLDPVVSDTKSEHAFIPFPETVQDEYGMCTYIYVNLINDRDGTKN